jgi:predicted CopG family antitoxin
VLQLQQKTKSEMIKEYLEIKKRQSQLRCTPQINQSDQEVQNQLVKSYQSISKWNIALN